VNGGARQNGNSKDMIFDLKTLSKYLKSRFPVQEGDVLLSGTPSGVSKLLPGDCLVAEITGKIKAQWDVAKS